jgi:hypothetical protein
MKDVRPLDRIIDKMSLPIWKAFSRSSYGQGLSNAGIKLNEYEPSTSIPKSPPEPEPEPKRKTCIQCGLEFPSHTGHMMCEVCIADADQHKAQPQPIPAPTSSNPLITALIAELNNAGYAPAQPIDAETVAEQVLERIKAQGMGGKQTIELKSNGHVVRTIEGKAPQWFPRLVKLAQCKVPALLVGPAGCGKTTAAKMLAQVLDVPFYRVSIAAGTDEGQLQGWLHPIGDNMRFDYVSSVVTKAYEQEQGGVVLIDDIDLGDPNALGILNAALDNGGWYIPLRHANPVFHRSEKFYILGAANTWGHGADRQYVGANQLDERTLSRFRMGQIPCDYDEQLEKDLFADDVVSFGHLLRARCRALPTLKKDVSTRDIESVHHMRAQFSLREAWYGFFGSWTRAQCQQVHASVNHVAMSVELD